MMGANVGRAHGLRINGNHVVRVFSLFGPCDTLKKIFFIGRRDFSSGTNPTA